MTTEQRMISGYSKTSGDHWKQAFKKDIKEKLFHAKIEYQKYAKTQQVIYLQQACNKLFSAVENKIMLKYGRKVTSYGKLREMVLSNTELTHILIEAKQIHQFYYNGDMQMSRYDAEDIFKRLLRQISN